jgi:hypothetical protein
MKIGEPVAGYVVEPIQEAVPQEQPKEERPSPPERAAARRELAPTR